MDTLFQEKPQKVVGFGIAILHKSTQGNIALTGLCWENNREISKLEEKLWPNQQRQWQMK